VAGNAGRPLGRGLAAMNRPEVVSAATLKYLPRQRVSSTLTVQPEAAGRNETPAPGVRRWMAAIWRGYTRMSVAADPLLSTVWIHGHCHDVSIYDRDWPESYRY
jgi:hypothetical protein